MKTYIWSFITRFYHWILAISFAGAFILGDEDNLRDFHIQFGIIALFVVVLRIIWGFIGPKYSKFTDFPLSIKKAIEEIKSINKRIKHNGHNPLASFVMIAIYVLVILTSLSGMALVSKETSYFAFLSGLPFSEHFIEDFHKIISKITLGLVVMHLLGVTLELITMKKESSLLSIFNGYKSRDGNSISLNTFQKIYSALSVFIIIFIIVMTSFNRIYINEKSEGNENDKNKIEHHEDKEHDD